VSDGTAIEWTDATWNPVRGCSRVSEGCRNCYAERVAARFSGPGMPYEGLAANGKWAGKTRLVADKLDQPLRWKRQRRIFVNSMSDLFHESLTDEQIDEVFAIMLATPRHTFQVLTKRPARMRAYSTRLAGFSTTDPMSYGAFDLARATIGEEPRWPAPNVWLGVSVENQAAADERIPLLLETPAAVRFLSCEPLLGPVNLTMRDDELGAKWPTLAMGIHWVIAGGESGPGARPCHPEWARSLRDQCAAAHVPFFFKQWGEFAPRVLFTGGKEEIVRPGKKLAGSLLDGVEHKAFPVGGVR
jgi:protein gp37